LPVLRALQETLPFEPLWYVADQEHFPTSAHEEQAVVEWAAGLTRFLIERGAKLVVVASHVASALALEALRTRFPGVPIVGVEPALRPALLATQSGVVGVLAPETMLHSTRYQHMVRRYSRCLRILSASCPGLVEQVEAGVVDGPEVEAILERAVQPMLEQRVDTFVLGCSHYSFVAPVLRKRIGARGVVVDSAPRVAQQVEHALRKTGRVRFAPGFRRGTRYFTTGDPKGFARKVTRLLGLALPPVVVPLMWDLQGSRVHRRRGLDRRPIPAWRPQDVSPAAV